MKSQVGETYTFETATLDYRWLTQLAVFTSVCFETIPDGEGVILLVQLTEVNKFVPAPVIRVTDENGLSLGLRFTSNNVLGAAAKASAYFTVGGTTNFGLRFKDPWIPGRSWWFGYTFKYEHAERRNEIFDFDERTDDVFARAEAQHHGRGEVGRAAHVSGTAGGPGRRQPLPGGDRGTNGPSTHQKSSSAPTTSDTAPPNARKSSCSPRYSRTTSPSDTDRSNVSPSTGSMAKFRATCSI